MPLRDAKVIAELAADIEALAERVDGEEGRQVLAKHAETIAEARRLVSLVSTAETLAPTSPSMAWSCPTCGAQPFAPCTNDGKFSNKHHANRLPPAVSP